MDEDRRIAAWSYALSKANKDAIVFVSSYGFVHLCHRAGYSLRHVGSLC